MKSIRFVLPIFLIMSVLSSIFSQADTEPIKYKGLAIDVFPLLNQVFSDDGSSSLFQLTYLWGRDNRRFEISMAPQYRKIKGDNDLSDLETLGSTIEFFHGKQFVIGKRWTGSWGLSYRYRYDRQKSKSFSGFEQVFELTTTNHRIGLGPQLMFGFKVSESVVIRSRIAAILQWQETKTKIKDGPFTAGDQKVTNINFGLNAPQVIDLVLFF